MRSEKTTQAAGAHQGGLTPLFMGIGTHYAHVYVGTPAQRVCNSRHGRATRRSAGGGDGGGKHTDPRWRPARSSTLVRLDCSKCVAGEMRREDRRCVPDRTPSGAS